MTLEKSFQDAMLQTEDIYQLIAVCYNKLLCYHNDSDMVFLAQVGNLRQDMFFRSHAEEFEDLRQKLVDLACQMDVRDDCDGIGFETFQCRLLQMINQFPCPKDLAENICIPVCIFFTLEALDFYLDNHLEKIYDTLQSCGPLNEGDSQNACLVYLHERESFLHDCYTSEKRDENFRTPHGPVRIGSIFHQLLLIRRTDLKSIPQIIPILLNNKHKKEIKTRKQLKIASIPYIGFDTFYFHALNQKCPCKPKEVPDGPFYVEYVSEWEEMNSRYVTQLLEKAIHQGANIVIFPEFIMSAATKKAVENCLCQLNPSCKQQLLFVMAGTHYCWDGVSKGNNILYVFNANGKEIGRYYKYSPFLQQAEEQIHGVRFSSAKAAKSVRGKKDEKVPPQPRRYLENCEILSDPGKECVLLDIEGIGRVLPAICRDVIDGVYTKHLTQRFMPSMLMVPAWSTSVESFRTHFEELANTIHTASLLCNCCNAVKEKVGQTMIGTFFMPAKEGSRMAPHCLPINRSRECVSQCRERGGCIFQLVLDFHDSQPTCELVVNSPKLCKDIPS